MKKKLCACIVAFALVLPFSGCAGNVTQDTSGSQSVSETQETPALPEVDPSLSWDDLEEDDAALRSFSVKTAALVLGDGAAVANAGTNAGAGAAAAGSAAASSDAAQREPVVCYSPASLYFALALLELGTEGEAQQQLLDLMGFADSQALAEACAHWLNAVEGDEEAVNKGEQDQPAQSTETLEIANSVWVDDELAFTDEYLKTVRKYLGAEAASVPLRGGDGGEQIAQWITEATKGLIKIDPVMFKNPALMSVLVNALYFKDAWLDVFDEESTTDGTFRGMRGDTTVSMMHQTIDHGAYRYDAQLGMHLAALDFKGGSTMVFALPDEGKSIDDLANDPNALAALLDMDDFDHSREVNWTLPRFTLESSLDDLVDVLKALGVEDVFGVAGKSTGITMFEGVDADATAVSDIIQKTYMDVNEEGAEAAAVTMVDIVTLSLPTESESVGFTVDEPFLFSLVSSDGIPLFMGRVDDLQK